MQNPLDHTSNQILSPLLILLILAGYVFGALLLFNIVGLVMLLPFYGFDFEGIINMIQDPLSSTRSRTPLLVIQGVSSIGAFILTPWFVISRYFHLPIRAFFSYPKTSAIPYLLVGLVTITFMGVNSFFIEWNMNLQLPEWMSQLEQIVRSKEDQLGELTRFITEFSSPAQFVLGVLVIAVIPAIGEELLFRGIIQNILHTQTRNVHVAIWVTGFLFGAFHLQFYGLVPRMLLGVLFGYLYAWSGHLSLAMFCHFINNGFMVLMVYLANLGVIDYDLDEVGSAPESFALLFFFVITGAVLWSYYRFFNPGTDEPLAKGF